MTWSDVERVPHHPGHFIFNVTWLRELEDARPKDDAQTRSEMREIPAQSSTLNNHGQTPDNGDSSFRVALSRSNLAQGRRSEAREETGGFRTVSVDAVNIVRAEGRTEATEEVHAVFRGGGARALAMVGALETAWEAGIRFASVAGTSGGALIAGLLAIGYTPKEIRKVMWNSDFSDLQDSMFQVVRNLRFGGLHGTDKLVAWIRLMIRKKTGGEGDVLIKDLPVPFAAIVTLRDPKTNTRKPLVLDRDTAPDLPLYLAMTLSSVLTPFFIPVMVTAALAKVINGAQVGMLLEDGGLAGALGCGFPVFLYEDPAKRGEHQVWAFWAPPPERIDARTLGDWLRSRVIVPLLDILSNPLQMFRRPTQVTKSPDEKMLDLYSWAKRIKIHVPIGTLQFGLKSIQKLMMLESGREAMRHVIAHSASERNELVASVEGEPRSVSTSVKADRRPDWFDMPGAPDRTIPDELRSIGYKADRWDLVASPEKIKAPLGQAVRILSKKIQGSGFQFILSQGLSLDWPLSSPAYKIEISAPRFFRSFEFFIYRYDVGNGTATNCGLQVTLGDEILFDETTYDPAELEWMIVRAIAVAKAQPFWKENLTITRSHRKIDAFAKQARDYLKTVRPSLFDEIAVGLIAPIDSLLEQGKYLEALQAAEHLDVSEFAAALLKNAEFAAAMPMQVPTKETGKIPIDMKSLLLIALDDRAVVGDHLRDPTSLLLQRVRDAWAKASGDVPIVTGYVRGVNMRFSNVSGALRGSSESPSFLAEEARKLREKLEQLTPEVRERVHRGKFLLEGPGAHIDDIYLLLKAFPDMKSLAVVDPSFDNLRRIKMFLDLMPRSVRGRIKLYHGDFSDLSMFLEHSFDAVYASRVYDRTRGVSKETFTVWLAELKTRLKSDGVVFTRLSDQGLFIKAGFETRSWEGESEWEFIASPDTDVFASRSEMRAGEKLPAMNESDRGLFEIIQKVIRFDWNKASLEERVLKEYHAHFYADLLNLVNNKPESLFQQAIENYLQSLSTDLVQQKNLLKQRQAWSLGNIYTAPYEPVVDKNIIGQMMDMIKFHLLDVFVLYRIYVGLLAEKDDGPVTKPDERKIPRNLNDFIQGQLERLLYDNAVNVVPRFSMLFFKDAQTLRDAMVLLHLGLEPAVRPDRELASALARGVDKVVFFPGSEQNFEPPAMEIYFSFPIRTPVIYVKDLKGRRGEVPETITSLRIAVLQGPLEQPGAEKAVPSFETSAEGVLKLSFSEAALPAEKIGKIGALIALARARRLLPLSSYYFFSEEGVRKAAARLTRTENEQAVFLSHTKAFESIFRFRRQIEREEIAVEGPEELDEEFAKFREKLGQEQAMLEFAGVANAAPLLKDDRETLARRKMAVRLSAGFLRPVFALLLARDEKGEWLLHPNDRQRASDKIDQASSMFREFEETMAPVLLRANGPEARARLLSEWNVALFNSLFSGDALLRTNQESFRRRFEGYLAAIIPAGAVMPQDVQERIWEMTKVSSAQSKSDVEQSTAKQYGDLWNAVMSPLADKVIFKIELLVRGINRSRVGFGALETAAQKPPLKVRLATKVNFDRDMQTITEAFFRKEAAETGVSQTAEPLSVEPVKRLRRLLEDGRIKEALQFLNLEGQMNALRLDYGLMPEREAALKDFLKREAGKMVNEFIAEAGRILSENQVEPAQRVSQANVQFGKAWEMALLLQGLEIQHGMDAALEKVQRRIAELSAENAAKILLDKVAAQMRNIMTRDVDLGSLEKLVLKRAEALTGIDQALQPDKHLSQESQLILIKAELVSQAEQIREENEALKILVEARKAFEKGDLQAASARTGETRKALESMNSEFVKTADTLQGQIRQKEAEAKAKVAAAKAPPAKITQVKAVEPKANHVKVAEASKIQKPATPLQIEARRLMNLPGASQAHEKVAGVIRKLERGETVPEAAVTKALRLVTYESRNPKSIGNIKDFNEQALSFFETQFRSEVRGPAEVREHQPVFNKVLDGLYGKKQIGAAEMKRFVKMAANNMGKTVAGLREAFEAWIVPKAMAEILGEGQVSADSYEALAQALEQGQLSRAQFDERADKLFDKSLEALGVAIRAKQVTALAPVIFYSPEMKTRLIRYIQTVQHSFESLGDVTAESYRVTIVSENKTAILNLKTELSKAGMLSGVHFIGDKASVDINGELASSVIRHPVFGNRFGIFFPGKALSSENVAWQRIVRTEIPKEYGILFLPALSRYFAVMATSDIKATTLRRALPDLFAWAEFRVGQGIAIVAEFLDHIATAAHEISVSA